MKRHRIYKDNVDKVRAALLRHDMTVEELAAAVEEKVNWTKHFVKDLRDDQMVHVWDWAADRFGRSIIPIYRWGPGENEPRAGKKPYHYKRKIKLEQQCSLSA